MVLLTVLLTIIIVLAIFALDACFFWGLGILIIKVFGITYNWTFWHGVVCSLVSFVLGSIFRGRK